MQMREVARGEILCERGDTERGEVARDEVERDEAVRARVRTSVVGDHDDASLEDLDGIGKSAQGVAIQVVGGLIQHQ